MGKTKAGRLYQAIQQRTAWPLAETIEEYGGDSAILHLSDYDRFQERYPNLLSYTAWLDIEREFQQEYTRYVQTGCFRTERWQKLSAQLQLQYNLIHDSCQRLTGLEALSDELLSNICEDHLPQIGLFSDELIFGALSLTQLSPPLRQLGGAVCSMLPLLKHGHSAIAKLATQRPRTSKDLHRSLTAYHRTPFMLWDNHPKTSGGVLPLLPLATQYIPDRPVQNLPDAPFFIGKIINLNDQFVASCVFGLSSADLLGQILTDRLQVEWIRYQRFSKITWEDILREKGDLLYRTAAELIVENKIKHR